MESRVQPSTDHDACGVGFIAHTRGRAGRDIVVARPVGAAPPDPPRRRGRRSARSTAAASSPRFRGPGSARRSAAGCRRPAPAASACCSSIPPIACRRPRSSSASCASPAPAPSTGASCRPIGAAVLRAQRDTTPKVLQVVAGFDEGRQAVDAALYRARLRIERVARTAGVRLTIVSLSTRTVVHKALVTPDALDRFYPDLADARLHLAVHHVPPALQHEHLGRLGAGAAVPHARAQRRDQHHRRQPPVDARPRRRRDRAARVQRRRADLDARLRLALARRCDRAAAAQRLLAGARGHAAGAAGLGARSRSAARRPRLLRVPVAASASRGTDRRRWSSPTAATSARRSTATASVPSRIVSTADDLIAVASEVGVLPADEHEIVNRDRLGPGDMIVVDVERGSVMGTNEIRRRLAFRRRYRRLVADVVRPLADPIGVDVGDPNGRSVGLEADPGPAERRTATATRRRRCRAGRRRSAARAKRSSCCSSR